MTTIYDDIGDALISEFPDFTLLNTATPTCYRTTAGDPTTDATQSNVGARAVSVISNAGSQMQVNAAGAGVWAFDFHVYSAPTVDVRYGDVFSDGTRAFIVIATPKTYYGFLFAPAEETDVPTVITTGGGFRSPLPWLGLSA